MFILFVLVLLSVFTYISYKNILWGMALLIVFLPSYLLRLSFYSWPSTFLELMIWILFFVWLSKDNLYKKINFNFSKKNINKIPRAWQFILLAWLFVSAVAVLVNFSFSSIGLWRAYWLEPMMVFLIFVYNIKTKEDVYFLLKAFGVLISGLFVISIFQYFSEWNLPDAYNYPNQKRLTAVYSYPNALALISAPIAGLYFALWAEQKKELKNIFFFLIFIFGLALSFLAFSEGAIVAIIFSVLIYLLFAKKTKKYATPVIFIGILMGTSILSINDYYNNFKQQLFEPELNLSATSLEIRSNQWQETIWMLRDNFIFGSGIDGYQQAMEPYRQFDWIETYLYPHNIFLNFWTEMGFFGLLLFVLILYYIIFSLKKLFLSKNGFAWPLAIAWLTWFVHGLVDVPYFKNDLSVLFFILLALTLSILNLEKNKHS